MHRARANWRRFIGSWRGDPWIAHAARPADAAGSSSSSSRPAVGNAVDTRNTGHTVDAVNSVDACNTGHTFDACDAGHQWWGGLAHSAGCHVLVGYGLSHHL